MDGKLGVTVGIWAVAFAASLNAQSAANVEASSTRTHVAVPSDAAGDVLREIDDPATGIRWLMLRDPNRPAGPGRLVPAPNAIVCREKDCVSKQLCARREQPVIHTGDAVTVEEHTPVLDMRLQAVALEPSLKGAYFTARLKVGGKAARVLAVAPGHAVFGPETEVKP